MSVLTMTIGRNDDPARLLELGIQRCKTCGQYARTEDLNDLGCSLCTKPCEGGCYTPIPVSERVCASCELCGDCDQPRTTEDMVGPRCWDCAGRIARYATDAANDGGVPCPAA